MINGNKNTNRTSTQNSYSNGGNGGKKPKKKMHPAAKFMLIVSAMVFAFLIVGGAGLMAYISSRTFEEMRAPNVYADTTEQKPGITKTVKQLFESVPERTNFVIAGVDDEGGGIRSDTIIMGSFDSKTKKISLVSVPRDIMVSIPKDDMKEYNALGIYPPSYMKMNEILAYVGSEYGINALAKQLEREFGVSIEYFVKIDTEGFRDLVDAIGGVEMTLTRNYNYYDPDQNLKINLKAGPQVLMGKDAEGFVRFRADYAGGDLQRIEVQQQFMGELFRQTLKKDNLIANAPALLSTVMDNVTTNMPITTASKYLQFLPALSSESLEMYSLGGGEAEPYRGPDGLSYIRLDQEHADQVIEDAFFGGSNAAPPADSKELKIAVLNGSGVTGMAKRTAEELELKGYTVSDIGDYYGTKVPNDRIFVKKSGYGQDLKKLFKESEIIVDKQSVKDGSDITVVLGTDNKGE